MSSLTTDFLKINKNIAFYTSFSGMNTKTYYIFTGKPSSWNTDSFSTEVVPVPLINFYSLKKEINDIIALKKIRSEDVSLAIKRYDWIKGSVYDSYNIFDENLLRKNHYAGTNPFYVMTDEYNIYKCLDNNKGAQSIEQPSGQFINPITLSDGYKWKFMFMVPEEFRVKFLSPEYIPVKGNFELSVNSSQYRMKQGAVAGAIEKIDVMTSGFGLYPDTADMVFTGDGHGLAGTLNLVNAGISSIAITNAGRDYSSCSITVTDNTNTNTFIAPQLRPQFAPQGGHGFNCLYELGSFYTIISVDLVGTEDAIFPINSYFRKTGIITDVLDIQGNFTIQDYFYGPQHKFYNNVALRNSNASKFIDSNFGSICYVNYHEKILRKDNQLERIKLIVETN